MSHDNPGSPSCLPSYLFLDLDPVVLLFDNLAFRSLMLREKHTCTHTHTHTHTHTQTYTLHAYPAYIIAFNERVDPNNIVTHY